MQIKDITDSLPRHLSKRYNKRRLEAITHIVVHHSATTSGTPEAFARYHVHTLGWPGIGYHYVIDRKGVTCKCHPATTISYHAAGANSYSIGVCLVGNLDAQKPTGQQMAALLALLRQLIGAYGIPDAHVIGHREVPGARKSCPGRNIDMDKIRQLLGRKTA